MQVETLAIQNLPPLLQAYFDNDPKLRDYFSYAPDLEGAKAAIVGRKERPVNREVLADCLLRQYTEMEEGFTQKPTNKACRGKHRCPQR